MKKIPTLFKRDPDNRSRVLPELAVELPRDAAATAKYDGSCVMFDGTSWWKRREVKPGKPIPDDFDEVDFDEVTGKRQGWVPIGDGPEDQWFRVATDGLTDLAPATFEAVGPHFKWACHVGLVREHLTVGGWRMSLSEVRLFDTASDALAAAFATDQIGAVE